MNEQKFKILKDTTPSLALEYRAKYCDVIIKNPATKETAGLFQIDNDGVLRPRLFYSMFHDIFEKSKGKIKIE